MTPNPTFSILTPVYNTEKFVSACIDSVLAQTFTDWDLILVDDGSTDTSGRICDEYASKYPDKIRVFHNTNKGQLYARNFALSKASGAYYIFLDSDDSLTCNALKTIYQKFQQYKCDCVIYRLAEVNEQGVSISALANTTETFFEDKRLLYRKILLDQSYNSLCRKAIKSSMVKLSLTDYESVFHIQYGEDLLQSLEILHNCRTILLIPDILYLYTQNANSITHTANKQPLQLSFEVREKVLEFLQHEDVFTRKDIQDYHNYCVRVFEEQIKKACLHSAKIHEKIKLFQAVKRQSYYKNFLASKQYKQPISRIYTQFKMGLYILMVLEIKLYHLIKG